MPQLSPEFILDGVADDDVMMKKDFDVHDLFHSSLDDDVTAIFASLGFDPTMAGGTTSTAPGGGVGAENPYGMHDMIDLDVFVF